MSNLIWIVLRPILADVFRSFVEAAFRYLRDRKALADQKALGHAEADAEGARQAAAAADRMASIGLPDDAAVIEDLRKGEA